ncbi:MAG: hypothetical protein R3B06_17595 [Kofleriaceae bacterium]
MRQLRSWAPWAACALVLALTTTTVFADRKRGKRPAKARDSIAMCTSFDQVDRDDEAIDLVVANDCEVALACAVSWKLTCVPQRGARQAHQHGVTFDLAPAQQQRSLASPEACGNDGWEIDDVVWSCKPMP